MPRLLPPGLHPLDQVVPDDHLLTDWADITPDAIDAFADLTGDRHEIHLSDEGARRHGFPARVAHGLLVLSLVEGLKSTAPARLDTFAALGWDCSFRAPVFSGDRIRARIEVKEKRHAGPGKCLVILSVVVENQKAETVLRGEAQLMGYFTR